MIALLIVVVVVAIIVAGGSDKDQGRKCSCMADHPFLYRVTYFISSRLSRGINIGVPKVWIIGVSKSMRSIHLDHRGAIYTPF